MSTLYDELEKYVIPLQRALIESIDEGIGADLDPELLNVETEQGKSLMRAIYYPAFTKEQMAAGEEPPQNWASAHTDIDLGTILPKATEKGLQVFKDGQWLNVVVPEDAFIVNIGDMLQNLTNGLFKSSLHRVVALEPGKERFSMVFFIHPKDETSLNPLPECFAATGGEKKYANGTRWEFLCERLIAIGLDKDGSLLKWYATSGHAERQIREGKRDLYIGNADPKVLRLLVVRSRLQVIL